MHALPVTLRCLLAQNCHSRALAEACAHMFHWLSTPLQHLCLVFQEAAASAPHAMAPAASELAPTSQAAEPGATGATLGSTGEPLGCEAGLGSELCPM